MRAHSSTSTTGHPVGTTNTAAAPARRRRALPAFVVAGLLGLIAAGSSASGAAASSPLIDATPATVTIEAPAPGEEQSWQMAVRNVSGGEISLSVRIEGEAERLFSGPEPLRLRLSDTSTGVAVVAAAAGDAVGTSVELPALAAGETYRLDGLVALRIEAGDEYQNAGGTLTFRFDAQAAEAQPDRLATTGGVWASGVLVAAALALAIGILLLARRRRDRENVENEGGTR
ncbi:hypothetical protein [Microbacterium hominis]|uniref:hypothetical protein n=1 Tax=Microbacterium hominis TaxID=162426 RepID=UPI000AD272FF|nr:hypothetical protein [Microbacterium hominis]